MGTPSLDAFLVNDPTRERGGLSSALTRVFVVQPWFLTAGGGLKELRWRRSRHPGIPPQFLALPLVVKSLFGVSGGATSVKSFSNIGERSRLDLPVQARH